jgi:ADP-ribosylglycohydrolase
MYLPRQKECIVGGLVGLAIGDAWGAPFAGMRANEISLVTRHEEVNRFFDPVQTNVEELRMLAPGQPTDNWHFAKAVAISLTAIRKFDLANCLRLQLLQQNIGACRSSEQTRKDSLVRYEILDLSNKNEYLPLVLKSVAEQTKKIGVGTGVVIKCVPLAYYYNKQPEAYLEAVSQLAELTHKDIQVVMSAYVFGLLVSYLYNNHLGFDMPETFRKSCEICDMLIVEATIFEKACQLKRKSCLHQNLVGVARFVKNKKHKNLGLISQRYGFSSCAHDSVTLAILLFLRSPINFLKALQEMVMLGGDTAGNCALVGALCGTNISERGIPIELRNYGTHFAKVAQLGNDFADMLLNVQPKQSDIAKPKEKGLPDAG